jgi:SAM-dependent methyltransferase
LPEPDIYLLGRSGGEEERLKRQIADLAPDSDAQLGKIGIRSGERIVDIGCGPGGVLHLLAKRVGLTGSVLGIDRSAHFVEQARRFAADLGLTQVEVREGDAYDTGLPRASFDGAQALAASDRTGSTSVDLRDSWDDCPEICADILAPQSDGKRRWEENHGAPVISDDVASGYRALQRAIDGSGPDPGRSAERLGGASAVEQQRQGRVGHPALVPLVDERSPNHRGEVGR